MIQNYILNFKDIWRFIFQIFNTVYKWKRKILHDILTDSGYQNSQTHETHLMVLLMEVVIIKWTSQRLSSESNDIGSTVKPSRWMVLSAINNEFIW